jgi:hypothetical protein
MTIQLAGLVENVETSAAGCRHLHQDVGRF